MRRILHDQSREIRIGLDKFSILLLFLLISTIVVAQHPTLTDEEVQQYFEDLGVVLSEQEKFQVAQLVKPIDPLPQWRLDANNRIEQLRKANLGIEIVDAQGNVIQDAIVRIELKRNAFNFGVVVRAEDLTDDKGRLANAGSSSEEWERLVLGLANAIGTGNNFKPKLASLHEYIPGFLDWTDIHDLYVRGHLLIWPGSKGIEEMDKPGNEIGIDYGKHLSQGNKESLHDISGYEHVISYDVQQAVLDFKNSNRTQADRNALEAVVDAEISQWAGLWNVREWDVINETLSCRLLMDILGYDQMAEWFKLAEANKVNSDGILFLNDYKIVSAPEDDGSIPDYLSYAIRKANYMDRIDQILADDGPIGGIGFQNRYTWGVPNPATTYERLDEFGSRYGLPMVGTEFELVDNKDDGNYTYDFSEMERARVTEETLTAYYSHPLTTGLYNWTFMDENEEKALCYYDGAVKLNGLVWYYLHKIRYHTDEQAKSDAFGLCDFRGFLGEYEINVEFEEKTYQHRIELNADTVYQIALHDVSTGLWDDHEDLDIRLQPNPVQQELLIKSHLPLEKIELVDVNGNTIRTQMNTDRIDMTSMPEGTYFLVCFFCDGRSIEKFVKL